MRGKIKRLVAWVLFVPGAVNVAANGIAHGFDLAGWTGQQPQSEPAALFGWGVASLFLWGWYRLKDAS
jgi:hypothetical protein